MSDLPGSSENEQRMWSRPTQRGKDSPGKNSGNPCHQSSLIQRRTTFNIIPVRRTNEVASAEWWRLVFPLVFSYFVFSYLVFSYLVFSYSRTRNSLPRREEEKRRRGEDEKTRRGEDEKTKRGEDEKTRRRSYFLRDSRIRRIRRTSSGRSPSSGRIL